MPEDTPPVKNTFIHFDEAAERPVKLRRTSSAPVGISTEVTSVDAAGEPKRAESKAVEEGGDGSKATTLPKKTAEAKVRWADVEEVEEDKLERPTEQGQGPTIPTPPQILFTNKTRFMHFLGNAKRNVGIGKVFRVDCF